jgi:hypothetical protein
VHAGCSVRIVLPDGAELEGRPTSFRPEAMDLHVYRSSNRQAHPKGSLTLPRQTVTVVGIRPRTLRWKGRAIGTLLPIGVGAGVGAPAGYFIGRASDRRFVPFAILPPEPGANAAP